MSESTGAQPESSYRVPSSTCLQHACKLAIVQDKPIKLQLNKLIHFSWFSGRSINKVSLTRGHVEHAFGHHAVLKKRPHNFKSFAPNGDLHNFDMSLFWGAIRNNVKQRANAF